MQIIAVGLLLWGVVTLIGEQTGAVANAMVRLMLAGVAQLLALTLFTIDRSK